MYFLLLLLYDVLPNISSLGLLCVEIMKRVIFVDLCQGILTRFDFFFKFVSGSVLVHYGNGVFSVCKMVHAIVVGLMLRV